MRTFTAAALVIGSVLGAASAAAHPGPDDDSSINVCDSGATSTPTPAVGGGPSARESARWASENARIAPPDSTPQPAIREASQRPAIRAASQQPRQDPTVQSTTPGPAVYALTGQRYGQTSIVAVPSMTVPPPGNSGMPQATNGLGPYGPVPQPPFLTPLNTPPPVVIGDGPSPTIGANGPGFMLPVPGAQTSGTLTNPNAR